MAVGLDGVRHIRGPVVADRQNQLGFVLLGQVVYRLDVSISDSWHYLSVLTSISPSSFHTSMDPLWRMVQVESGEGHGEVNLLDPVLVAGRRVAVFALGVRCLDDANRALRVKVVSDMQSARLL